MRPYSTSDMPGEPPSARWADETMGPIEATGRRCLGSATSSKLASRISEENVAVTSPSLFFPILAAPSFMCILCHHLIDILSIKWDYEILKRFQNAPVALD